MTYKELQRIKAVYEAIANLDVFDLPPDHEDRARKQAAHIAYLRASAAYTGISADAMIAFYYGTQEIVIPALNERAQTWYERMKAREGHWAAQAAQQFGPLPAPTKTTFLDIKGAREWAKARKAQEDQS